MTTKEILESAKKMFRDKYIPPPTRGLEEIAAMGKRDYLYEIEDFWLSQLSQMKEAAEREGREKAVEIIEANSKQTPGLPRCFYVEDNILDSAREGKG